MFDTMTLTKIAGGFCGALLVFLLGNWAGGMIYSTGGGGHGEGEEHKAGYVIHVEESGGGGEEEAEPTIAELYADADPGKGESIFNKCKACHSVAEGENGTGPTLHGVVGRTVDSIDGFGYSGALEKVAETWTPENLYHFLKKPAGFAPGTAMGFAGLPKPEDRANVIAYLDQTDGDMTEVEAPAPEEGAEAAEGEAAEGEAAAEDEAAEEQPADAGDAAGDAAEEQPAAGGDGTAAQEAAPTDEAAPQEAGADEPAGESAAPEAAEEDSAGDAPAAEDTSSEAEPAAEDAQTEADNAADGAEAEDATDAPEGADETTGETPVE